MALVCNCALPPSACQNCGNFRRYYGYDLHTEPVQTMRITVPKQDDTLENIMPVGYEFWGDWHNDRFSTDTRDRRFMYRVIGHNRCSRFEGDKTGELLPTLQAIRVEYREPRSVMSAV